MGGLYAIVLLLWKNEVWSFEVSWFFALADLPFLFVSLCYFLGGIRVNAEEKYLIEKMGESPAPGTFSFLNLVLWILGGGLLILFFLLDVLFPFLQNPHKGELPFLAFFGM